MNDSCESDEEIPLPPLPTKPQKTLFSFLPKKSQPNHPKSEKDTIPDSCHTTNGTGSDLKETGKVKDSDLEYTKKSKTVPNCASFLIFESEQCSVPTPFPLVNHVRQFDGASSSTNITQTGSRKLPLRSENYNQDFIPGSHLLSSYKSLLCFEQKECSIGDSVTTMEEKSVEEWLTILIQKYPDIPVKKVFIQYLSCQKDTITRGLAKKESSKKALDLLWKRDSEFKLSEQFLNNKNIYEKNSTTEPEPPPQKEGKDIRDMFKKKIKKKKLRSKVKDKTEASKQAELEVSKDHRKNIVVENGTKTWIDQNVKEIDQKSIDDKVKDDNEDGRVTGISLSGLFGKAQKRLEEKKRKREQLFEDCSKNENHSKSNHHEVKHNNKKMKAENNVSECNMLQESVCNGKSEGKDLRMFFTRVDKTFKNENIERRLMKNSELNVQANSGINGMCELRERNASRLSDVCDENEQPTHTQNNSSKEEKRLFKDIRSMFCNSKTEDFDLIKVSSKLTEVTMDKHQEKSLLNEVDSNENIEVILEHDETGNPLRDDNDVKNVSVKIECTNVNGTDVPKTNGTHEITEKTDCTVDMLSNESKKINAYSWQNLRPLKDNSSFVNGDDLELVKTDAEEKPKALNDTSVMDHTFKPNAVYGPYESVSSTIIQRKISNEDAFSAGNDKTQTVKTNMLDKSNMEKNSEERYNDKPLYSSGTNENNSNIDSLKDIVTPCKVKLEHITSPTLSKVSPHLNKCITYTNKPKCSVELFTSHCKQNKNENYLEVSGANNNKTLDIDSENPVKMEENVDTKKSAKRKRVVEIKETSKKFKNDPKYPLKLRKSLRNHDKSNKDTVLCNTKDDLSVTTADEDKSYESLKETNEINGNIDKKLSSPKKNTANNFLEKTVLHSDGLGSYLNVQINKSDDENVPVLRRSSRRRTKTVNYCELDAKQREEEQAVSDKVQSRNNESTMAQEKQMLTISKDDVVMDESLIEMAVIPKKCEVDRIVCSPKKTRPAVEIIFNEDVINSFLSWTEKYQPSKARFVIGDREKIKDIFSWLSLWKEKHEVIIKKLASRAVNRSSKNYASDSDFESDDSDDEDLLTNTLILTGLCGSGTTAAVYACAKQMDFKVLELNPSTYRTGKLISDQVAEAVVSHRVGKGIKSDTHPPKNNLTTFFSKEKTSKGESKRDKRLDEMSLVLFEQGDIIFEELDKGFWLGFAYLKRLAKRPIILTATDEIVKQHCNTDETSYVEHISLTRPSCAQIVPMMQIMCLVEQVYVPESLLLRITNFCKNDIRKIMMQLQFWFEQSKQPLFNVWKPKNKNEIPINSENNQEEPKLVRVMETDEKETTSTGCSDFSLKNTDHEVNAIESPTDNIVENSTCCAKELTERDYPSTDCKNLAVSEQKAVMIKRTNLSRLPFFQEDFFFSKDKLLEENNFTQMTWSHHSFVKEKMNKRQLSTATGSTKTDCSDDVTSLSNMADMLSFMDSYSCLSNQNKDCYPWTVIPRESLEDCLSITKFQVNPYPIEEFMKSALCVVEECHERVTDSFDNRLEYIQNRASVTFGKLYASIKPRFGIQHDIDRRIIPMDILPCLRNICLSEDVKRATQQRRKNRRYLHYLDSIHMCLDDDVITQLSQPIYK